ncbi:MAG: hypothetical protein DSY42_03055 [Aquifex sp.]|nr:MAG: hypothetical protein DSY42_03055 [Aquifex sp.]
MKAIIGVPGAGKTTFLAKELVKLSFDDYIFTSLTNSSIRAFLSKIGEREKKRSIRTIYGLAYKKLDEEGMLDEWKKKELKNYEKKIGELIVDYGVFSLYKEDIENILTLLILEALERQAEPEEVLDNIETEVKKMIFSDKTINRVFFLLEDLLSKYKQRKFYGYPFLLYEAFRNNLDIFKVFLPNGEKEPELIVIDEFQDTPKFIFEYLSGLRKDKKLLIAGDPAQEIFSFLKTDSNYLLSKISKIKYLVQTHRFGEEICSLANRLLKKLGYGFKIKPANKESRVLYFNYSYSNLVSVLHKILKHDKEVAILVRTKNQVRILEEKLSQRFDVINLEKYDMSVLQNYLKKYEETLKNKRTSILDYFKPLEQLRKEVLREIAPGKQIENILLKLVEGKVVYLSTIHGVKGLEFNNVIIWDAIPRKIEKLLDSGEISEKEELKTIYVGITRAKRLLIVLKEPDGYFNSFNIS